MWKSTLDELFILLGTIYDWGNASKMSVMKKSDEFKDELENSPFLKKMKERPAPKGTSGFQVPKNYFQHLPNEVMRKVKEPLPTPAMHPNLWEKIGQFVQGFMQPGYALALASVVIMVVAAAVFFKDKNTIGNLSAEVRLADIPDAELFAYVSENINEYDHEQVLEATGAEIPEVKQKTKTPTLPKITTPKPDTKEIEEYLNEAIDEIDVEDLEEML